MSSGYRNTNPIANETMKWKGGSQGRMDTKPENSQTSNNSLSS